MIQEKFNIIGLMSGTSLDGIDLSHLNFEIINGKWNFQILEYETIGYNQEWIDRLKNAVGFSESELLKLNKEYTLLLGNCISDFISKHQLENIDAVCSHGHTVLHQPKNSFTLQIGNLPEISPLCNQKVVCDFRVQDVELGGQGAPLVPIGDRLLFSEADYCLNLGGFSNISFEENGNRIAFDISPVNTVLNFYANKLGLEYDDKGIISSSGKINSELLNELNELEFYNLSYPKSLGFEFVKEIVLPIIERYKISIENKLATFTEHIAYQVGMVLPNKKAKLLITGGGAYNYFLIGRIQYYLKETELLIPEKKIIEFKEALIFGLLGVLKLRNEINTLSSVTGASKDHSSGKIYYPK